VIKQTVVIIEAYHCRQIHTKFYQTFFSLGKLHTQMKLLGKTNVDSGVIDQRLTNFLCPADIGVKWDFNGTVLQLFMYFKKA
jgi:hypothetical protein